PISKRIPLWTVLVTLLVPMGARAGVIRGTLRVPPSGSGAAVPVAVNPYPGRAQSMVGEHGEPRGLPTAPVVYGRRGPAAVESILARASALAPMPRLAQKDQSFVPRVLAIAAGTRVDFPNLDPIFHNVFSLSPARRFDLGKYPRGDSRRIVFPKPGLVNV